MRVKLRPSRTDDGPFLATLYATTREQELEAVPWSAAQKADFLRAQFAAQSRHYAAQFPNASFDVIEYAKTPVGRLCVDRRSDELRIVDIAILPEYRGMGFGTQLLQSLLEEASDRRLCVRIHVEANNPARRLYRRMGFRPLSEEGIYHLWEWQRQPGKDMDHAANADV